MEQWRASRLSQVINPDLQKKKMRKAHERFMRYHAISMIAQQMGGLLDSHGRVSRSKASL